MRLLIMIVMVTIMFLCILIGFTIGDYGGSLDIDRRSIEKFVGVYSLVCIILFLLIFVLI